MDHDTIAVIDFGGQYAHLIAMKIRRLGVRAEIRQPEDPVEAYEGYRGIVISGSPSLSSQGEDSAYTKEIYDLEIPILGFCFGHQEIAKHYGGRVVHGRQEWVALPGEDFLPIMNHEEQPRAHHATDQRDETDIENHIRIGLDLLGPASGQPDRRKESNEHHEPIATYGPAENRHMEERRHHGQAVLSERPAHRPPHRCAVAGMTNSTT